MDDDLNELLLKKIKLQEDENDDQNHEMDSSMEYASSDAMDEENRSRERLITILRSYIEAKKERKERLKEEARIAEDEEEKETEDAQMFKSIRSMMMEGGLSSSSNTTSTDNEDFMNEDGLEQPPQLPAPLPPLPPLPYELLSDFDASLEYDDALPSNLIVTGLPGELFSSPELKREFEALFTRFDSACRFGYFRLLKRCSVQFDEPIVAVLVRLELDRIDFAGAQLKMYLNKPIKLKNTRAFLEPPKNDKGFLISPPSSPPVGWESQLEDPPVVNLDLLVALSKLEPHEPCELVKSNHAQNTPCIIVHPCPDIYLGDMTPEEVRNMKVIPTRRPPDQF